MNQDRAPILRLEDISKSFSGVTVLDGINLNLYGHEVLALMGENGAGKSTLMNILSGNLMRDSGKISRLPAKPLNLASQLSIRNSTWFLL